ncbi:hypothetical protein DRQ07_09655 [candidate division KSB1 bacterium]|nr:MAG: hypothetical protein DRQ07_09655 [candidate division KSB1 bacterium]
MKKFLFTISLTSSIIVFCIGIFTGVRFLPAMWRSMIAFFTTYAGGLVVAMVFFTTLYSSQFNHHTHQSGHAGSPGDDQTKTSNK